MSAWTVDWAQSGDALLAALLAGHLVADFVLQPSRMLRGKREEVRWMLTSFLVAGVGGMLLQALVPLA